MKDDYRESPEIQHIKADGKDIEYLPDLLDGIKEYGIILPNKNVQFPIIKHYLCAPSHKCNVLGVLFSQGASGSGKSDLTKIAAAIHGLSGTKGILMAESTPTAIRNDICEYKYGEGWLDHLEAGGSLDDLEKNCILLWDDISPAQLKNPFTLSLLKSSYNRSSAIVKIAISGEGKNMPFNTFSKKVTSSIHPIWQQPELVELKRRIFPIKHCNYDALSPEDKANNLSPDSDKLILWEYVDFGDYQGFDNFWNQDRLDAFSRLSRDRKVRNVVRKSNIPNKQIQISYDVIIAGMIVDDLSVGDIVDTYEEYWAYVNDVVLSKQSALHIFLEDYIKQSYKSWIQNLPDNMSHEIASDELSIALRRAVVNGQILDGRYKSHLSDVMAHFGYEQQRSLFNRSICWKKIG